jgi:hypothetical protein
MDNSRLRYTVHFCQDTVENLVTIVKQVNMSYDFERELLNNIDLRTRDARDLELFRASEQYFDVLYASQKVIVQDANLQKYTYYEQHESDELRCSGIIFWKTDNSRCVKLRQIVQLNRFSTSSMMRLIFNADKCMTRTL